MQLKLLSNAKDNSKLIKSNLTQKRYLTVGLSLAPHIQSGRNVCKDATTGCSSHCLFFQGRARFFSRINQARLQKTRLFFENRSKFRKLLFEEIAQSQRDAIKKNSQLAVRLNVFSDLPWEKIYPSLFSEFPLVQFYDYTKRFERLDKVPFNYYLTFSRSEINDDLCKKVLTQGGNVAVVFRKTLPRKYMDISVINGDKHDLRFLDPTPRIIGLKAKGSLRKDETGFVI